MAPGIKDHTELDVGPRPGAVYLLSEWDKN